MRDSTTTCGDWSATARPKDDGYRGIWCSKQPSKDEYGHKYSGGRSREKPDDAHDNPTIMLDDAGHVWIFSAAHDTARPSWIHRSTKPWSVDEFEQIFETDFSYARRPVERPPWLSCLLGGWRRTGAVRITSLLHGQGWFAGLVPAGENEGRLHGS